MPPTVNIKLKLWWIIVAITIVTLAAYFIPRWKFFHPSVPSATDAARDYQSSPDGTVNTMFQMIHPGTGEPSPEELLNDRFDDAHFVENKDMTPDEQKFAGLFWDRFRTAAIYDVITQSLAVSPSITDKNEIGDS